MAARLDAHASAALHLLARVQMIVDSEQVVVPPERVSGPGGRWAVRAARRPDCWAFDFRAPKHTTYPRTYSLWGAKGLAAMLCTAFPVLFDFVDFSKREVDKIATTQSVMTQNMELEDTLDTTEDVLPALYTIHDVPRTLDDGAAPPMDT